MAMMVVVVVGGGGRWGIKRNCRKYVTVPTKCRYEKMCTQTYSRALPQAHAPKFNTSVEQARAQAQASTKKVRVCKHTEVGAGRGGEAEWGVRG